MSDGNIMKFPHCVTLWELLPRSIIMLDHSAKCFWNWRIDDPFITQLNIFLGVYISIVEKVKVFYFCAFNEWKWVFSSLRYLWSLCTNLLFVITIKTLYIGLKSLQKAIRETSIVRFHHPLKLRMYLFDM